MSETSQRELGKSDSPLEDELEDAFTRMIGEGTQRLHRSVREILTTGFFGGTEVAMGVLAYLAVLNATHQPLLAGLAFSIGFLALLLGRSELFTEASWCPSPPWLPDAPVCGSCSRCGAARCAPTSPAASF